MSQLIYENELPRCVNLEYYNVCTPNIHKLIYQRIYTDQLESLVKETFEYKNMYFFLSPIVSIFRFQESNSSSKIQIIIIQNPPFIVQFEWIYDWKEFFFPPSLGGRNLAAIVHRSDSLFSRGGAR